MSEAVFTVDEHFEGKDDVVRQIYDQLLAALRQFGTVQATPRKSSIHLVNVSGFAGIYPRKNFILLQFRTARKIDSARIEKTEQLAARRFKHTARLSQPAEVDEELLDWLKSAYELAG